MCYTSRRGWKQIFVGAGVSSVDWSKKRNFTYPYRASVAGSNPKRISPTLNEEAMRRDPALLA